MSPPKTDPALGTATITSGPPTMVDAAPPAMGVATAPPPSAPLSGPTQDPLHIRALTLPDAQKSADDDDRPRWERARMPKNEWERALRANDAEIAKVPPGSDEFVRLMEARVRMHFPPPTGVSLDDIDVYKAQQLRAHVGQAGGEQVRRRRVVLAIAILAMVGLVAYLVGVLVLTPPTPPPGDATPTAAAAAPDAPTTTAVATAASASPAPTATASAVEPEPSAAASAAPTPTGPTISSAPVSPAGTGARPDPRAAPTGPAPTGTAPTTAPAPASSPTGGGLYFKRTD